MKFSSCFLLIYLGSFILCSCNGSRLMEETAIIENNISINDQEASLTKNTTDISTPSPHSESTREESIQIFVTSTPLDVTKTPTVTLNKPVVMENYPTDTSSAVIGIQCLELEDGPPQSMNLVGSLVLVNDSMLQPENFIYDLSSGNKTIITDSDLFHPAKVSPNNNYLAYFVFLLDKKILRVMDADGNIITEEIDHENEWVHLNGWINNEIILVSKYQSQPYENVNTLGAPLPAILFYPFKQEKRELPPDYPDIVKYEKIDWIDYGLTGTGYDPTMSLVAYIRKDETIALWDINTNTEIATLPSGQNYYDGPVWFKDGSKFVLVSQIDDFDDQKVDNIKKIKQDLYDVSREGIITRLTYLSENYEEVSIAGYQWSPDGQYLAFWTLLSPENFTGWQSSGKARYRLAVFNIKKHLISLYCLPAKSPYYPPVWSLDGNHLAVGIQDGDEGLTAIVDIQLGKAFRLIDETIPVGWLARYQDNH